MAYCDGDPVAHANFRDTGKLVLAMIALYLDATGGLTHRRLREISQKAGTLSAGRATAILLHLRMIGYVTAVSTRADGSARLYVPTQKMREVFRNRIRIDIEALAMLEPEVDSLLARFAEDETFRIFMAEAGNLIGEAKPNEEEGLVRYDAITSKNAGQIIIYNLLQAADHGREFPPLGPAPVSVSALSRRFGVSRAHVLRVLREMEDGGFVTRAADGNGYELQQRLHDAFRQHFALVHLILGGVAYATLQVLKQNDRAAAQ